MDEIYEDCITGTKRYPATIHSNIERWACNIVDDPFEVGKKTYADIDFRLMYKLEERLKNL